MTDKKISELVAATTPLAGTELVPIVQGGETVRTTIDDFVTAAGGRETVTSDRVYYVDNVSGSDSNDGLTSLTAFATIGAAVDIICDTLYNDGADISIQLATTGVDYDEYVYLRPWVGVGGNTAIDNVIKIKGDATDRNAVNIKPTTAVPTDPLTNAVVQATGTGANWQIDMISVDAASCTGANGCGLWAAVASAKLVVMGGDMGSVYDPNLESIAYFIAYYDGWLSWQNPSGSYDTTQSHATGSYGMFASAVNRGVIELNGSVYLDNANAVYAFLYADKHSVIYTYHNVTFSNIAVVTGRRFYFRDLSRGFAWTQLPGDTAGICGQSAFFNHVAFRADYTVAQATAAGIVAHYHSGSMMRVSDSATKELGAVITGGGAYDVVGIWDGSNLRVAIAFEEQAGGGLTVGTTAIASGTATRVLYEGAGNVLQEDDEFTYDSAGAITLGKATGGTGKVLLKGTTSGTVTLSTADAAGTWTMKLPTGAGSNTYLLQTDGTGVTSWVAPPSAGDIEVGVTTILSGTAGRVLYEDATNKLGEASAFTISSNQPNVASGSGYLYNTVRLASAQTALNNYWFGPAGNFTATGNGNVALGNDALASLTDGTNNMAVGGASLTSLTGGDFNTAVGVSALDSLTTGNHNFGLGGASLSAVTTGSRNIGIGHACGTLTTGDANIYIGYAAGTTITAGTKNVFIGENAANAGGDGNQNVGIGSQALQNVNGGDKNTCIGEASGYGITSGDNNVLYGNCIGAAASYNQVTTGSNNVSIGYSVAVPTATASNQLCISNFIYGTGMDGTGSTISAGKVGLGIKAPATTLDVDGPVKTKGYTVATLPAAAAGLAGARAYVTDATAPTFLGALTGGGAVVCPVFCDGTNWVSA